MKAKFAILTLTALAAHQANLQAQDINSLLSEWSVVTVGNLDMVNDIQGAAYVGGNVTVPNSFNAGTVGNSAIPTSEVSLAVAGSIENGGNLQVNGGSVVAGGAISRTINLNSGGTQTQNDPAGLPASPVAQIANASQYWSGLTGNSITAPGNGNGQLDFNCTTGSSLAIFNVQASAMFGSGYQGFTLMPASGTGEILININAASTGGVINWTTGGFFSQFNTQAWDGRVVFNFYNATSVTLSGQIGGYVIAPNANVVEDNNIDGGVMAKTLTVDSEVDLPVPGNPSAWFGDLPNAPVIPEPSTVGAGAGLAALAMAVLPFRRGKRMLA
jgi:choice-of-anchor A domain-containing protein